MHDSNIYVMLTLSIAMLVWYIKFVK